MYKFVFMVLDVYEVVGDKGGNDVQLCEVGVCDMFWFYVLQCFRGLGIIFFVENVEQCICVGKVKRNNMYLVSWVLLVWSVLGFI